MTLIRVKIPNKTAARIKCLGLNPSVMICDALAAHELELKKFGGADKAVAKIHSTRGLSVRVAEACGIHRVAVYHWRRVPAERVHAVAKVIGMAAEDIRPDIFRHGR